MVYMILNESLASGRDDSERALVAEKGPRGPTAPYSLAKRVFRMSGDVRGDQKSDFFERRGRKLFWLVIFDWVGDGEVSFCSISDH
jgi:hypothetical protein